MEDVTDKNILESVAMATVMLQERNGGHDVLRRANEYISIWAFTRDEVEALGEALRTAVEDSPAGKLASKLLPLCTQVKEIVSQYPDREPS